MSIVITGATGQLGRHVVEALLERNVPAAGIVAAGRSIEKLADFAARGVQVRAMDYADAASVAKALEGASKVLLISGSEVGRRVDQHRTVIEAAKAEGVELIAYTSIANAGTTGMKLADEHQATESILTESVVPFALLRNGWYLENYTDQLQGTLAQGALAGSAGEGKVSAASPGTMPRLPQPSSLPITRPARSTNSAGTTPSRSANWPGKSAPRPTQPWPTRTSRRAITPGSWPDSAFRRRSPTSWRTRISASPAATSWSAARTCAP